MIGYKDDKESPTMREIHRIQDEMEQQYQKSGLPSYEEWLQATEADLRQSLAEIGYRMITRGDRFFLYEIKPRSQKHKNYDYTKDSTMRGLHLIREKTEQEYRKNGLTSKEEKSPSEKKRFKYKTLSKPRKTNVRKK
jgi:hypothetical protein